MATEAVQPTDVDTEVDAKEIQVIVFRLGHELYGVEISTVMEINTVQKITPVPRAPADVRGIMNLRGRIVTVVDLRERLGLPLNDDSRDTRIMVVEAAGAMVGCLVDQVREVVTLPESSIEPAESVVSFGEEYLLGIAKLESGVVPLVDLRQVLADFLQASD